MPLLTPLVFWLLAALTLKHFLADFVLQNRWMASGKEAPAGWALPLACHAGLHGIGTGLIALAFVPEGWWLGLADFIIHAAIDRVKAVAGRHFRLEPEAPAYWWLFGFDQFLHQVTNLLLGAAMIWLLVN